MPYSYIPTNGIPTAHNSPPQEIGDLEAALQAAVWVTVVNLFDGASGVQSFHPVGDLDTGNGVPVKDVSAMLHVDPSFVTTQSKMLEKNGFMRRVPSRQDARVVLRHREHQAAWYAQEQPQPQHTSAT